MIRVPDISAVSEPIGLEIVSSNNGSYTGAILFTGFMYLGAAVVLWFVRAWKIGQLEEEKAAKAQLDSSSSDPVAGEIVGDEGEPSLEKIKFSRRFFMAYKV